MRGPERDSRWKGSAISLSSSIYNPVVQEAWEAAVGAVSIQI
jgi:hypothetical protein